jgi:hypothetical protein
MTEATGVIANAGLGVAGIGAPTNVVSGDAAIGGWPMAIGISTIIRWMGRRTSFQTSNMQIRRSNKSRRRRPAANMHLRLRAGANMRLRLRVRRLLLRRRAKGRSAAQWGRAVVGGILGGVLTGRPGGAAAGAIIGGATGAAIGAQAEQRHGYYLWQGVCYYRYPSGQYAAVDPHYCN